MQMKKYIVSDLDGNGEVYDSIMGYLDNVALVDDVELYIDGDLINRGLDGYRMLEDVVARINGKGNVKINYLGGTHELIMHQALKKRKPDKTVDFFSPWMENGGWFVEGEIDALEDKADEVYDFYRDFLGELDVYKKFDEKINGNNILLVHASSPEEVLDKCHLKIKDDNPMIEDIVYKREWIDDGLFFPHFAGENDLSKEGYFIIKGHTPIKEYPGFIHNSKQNYLNIDGGCSSYACGDFDVDHIPLVEVDNDHLNIFIFNHNNEIIDGYVFDGEVRKMEEEQLKKSLIFIDHKYDNCQEKNKELLKEILEIKNQ